VTEKPQRKMVNIDVVETSGVDHPAHLHEGWVVMKSADPASVENLFGNLNTTKEVTPMADLTKEEQDALVAKAAKLEAENAELTTKLAKAAPAPAPTQEDLLKAVPEEVRQMLKAAEQEREDLKKQAAADREELRKEREERLDAAAISSSKSMFKSLAFDHEVVAPALRKFADANPDVAKALTDVLKAAEGQLESAGIFQELGKSAGETAKTAAERIKEAADELRKADSSLTPETAFTKAVEANPDLYIAYTKGE
jgi:hypothetical protein